MENERIRIGQRIAEIRKEKGFSQGDLAEVTGLKQNAISRIEQGKFNIGFDTLQKIAEAFGKKVDLI